MGDLLTTTFYIQLITSILGSVGFALMFKMRARHLAFGAVGGGLTYAVYYFMGALTGSVFGAAFLGSAASALFSEICARVKRAPALIFLVPCAIPIVPGGSLYRMMLHLISQEFEQAWGYMMEALEIGIGIAGGIVAVSLCFSLSTGVRNHLKAKRAAKIAEASK